MPIIELESSDKVVYKVDMEIARFSRTLKTMFEDLGMCDEEIIPIININSVILKKIIQWATYHWEHPKLIVTNAENKNKQPQSDEISSWDREFLNVDQATLFELILAANYLHMEELLDISCKTVANMIKGKEPAEIRKIFNIENDLPKSFQDQAQLENDWCEEK